MAGNHLILAMAKKTSVSQSRGGTSTYVRNSIASSHSFRQQSTLPVALFFD
jgi:hypothetical protein